MSAKPDQAPAAGCVRGRNRSPRSANQTSGCRIGKGGHRSTLPLTRPLPASGLTETRPAWLA